MKKSIYAPWLVRFYHWYHEDRRRRRQEDLCHFGRVVFFWAPLYWFFERRIFGWVRPWLIVLSTALLTFYVVLFAAQPQMVRITTIYLLAIVAGSAAIFAVAVPTLQSLDHGRLGKLLVWPEHSLVHVWMFLAVGAFAILSYFAAYHIVMVVMISLGLAAVLGGAAGIIVLGGYLVVAAFKGLFAVLGRILPPLPSIEISFPAPVANAFKNAAGAISLGWNWLLTLKRRTICPWVTFKDGVIEFEFALEPSKPSVLAEQMQRATDVVMSSATKVQTVIYSKPKGRAKRKAGTKSKSKSKPKKKPASSRKTNSIRALRRSGFKFGKPEDGGRNDI